MAKNNLRGSDTPVEVGMVVYVSPTDGTDTWTTATCHFVTVVEAPIKVWSDDARAYVMNHQYRVRPATVAEEAAYLALPRTAKRAFRAVVG